MKPNDLAQSAQPVKPSPSFLGLQYPIFMPDATSGVVRSLTTRQLEETGTEMIVVNTFHLYVQYGIEKMESLGGIKTLMGWTGKVLSDSGGFQVYSLLHRKPGSGKVTSYGAYVRSPVDGKKVVLTPEISIDMQAAIGSDVLIVLDDCRSSEISRKEAEESVRLTTQWARRAKSHFMKKSPEVRSKSKLFAVVHGGPFEDLREKSAGELIEIGFDGYCFGGWPVDASGRLVTEILSYTAELLPDDKPKYAMGVGTPDDIRVCRELGYTMFDCVLPTRNARHGLLYTFDGELRITRSQFGSDMEPIENGCPCEACRNYTRAYMYHLFKASDATAKTLATIHNLTFYQRLTRSLRETRSQEKGDSGKNADA